jgi:diaminopimelate decarboxylase
MAYTDFEFLDYIGQCFPGQTPDAPAGLLLTRVLYIKEMGNKTFVITDAGMNDLLRPSHNASYHGVEPVRRDAERPTSPVDVVGPICESGDFLALDRPIARVEPGELLAIRTVGVWLLDGLAVQRADASG